jgi:hypothetical protein
MNAEKQRLEEDRLGKKPWRLWGPYLSERQWGTVREDYSPDGDAWNYFTHDQSRSRAYRWGEDGLAGVSDAGQRLCLAVALWNGRDPIFKERLFGLTNSEGNHGEDIKEHHYYLDATPTASYLKMLYKYPQREFPYGALVEENRRRGKLDSEFELIDTGIFDDDRYFDVFVEYAKAGPADLLMRITAHNRGPEAAPLHILPQLWFRNTWSASLSPKPSLTQTGDTVTATRQSQPERADEKEPPDDSAAPDQPHLVRYTLAADGDPEWLFCDNETNVSRVFGSNGQAGYFKDGFHEYVIRGNRQAVNTQQTGTKAAAHYVFTVPAGGSVSVRVRLSAEESADPFNAFDALFEQRRQEADAFYAELQQPIADCDARLVQRQALANLVWSRQFYYLDVPQWLHGDPGMPRPPAQRSHGRNHEWQHLNNADVLTMPDKWEYPYYCIWDSAFQCIPIALIDPDWAKRELLLFLREWYMHPNGQVPAYEWNFNDVNPPVHAWAVWRIYQIDRNLHGGKPDRDFLERAFHKLMLNFTWWVNRKDAHDLNIFQGGFLGMDNIGVFDRSAGLPGGGYLNQADGTSWMAMYCLNLMRMALELAKQNHVYEDVATKFFEHFLFIARAMTDIAGTGIGLWDEGDRFYYDQLDLPDGRMIQLKVRSMVGLVPLFAVEVLEPELLEQVPDFHRHLKYFLNYRPDLARLVSHWEEPGRGERRLLSLLRGSRMKALLRRLLDESEFLSEHGPRTLSRSYRDRPFVFDCGGTPLSVTYRPEESDSGMFGGNSNWRGPIWMPVTYLLIESLQRFHHYYGDDFKVECPTHSGQYRTLNEVADELSRRLQRLFLRDEHGRRVVFGPREKLQNDPHFRDYLIFSEYFDGDTGRGLGTMHQGWTCLIAKLLQPRRTERPEKAVVCPYNAGLVEEKAQAVEELRV